MEDEMKNHSRHRGRTVLTFMIQAVIPLQCDSTGVACGSINPSFEHESGALFWRHLFAH